MKFRKIIVAAGASLLVTAVTSHAAVTGFTSSPNNNSINWAAAVAAAGGTINTNVNFNAHPLGALQPGFYAGSDGVTLTPTGDVNTVTTGAGPGQGNNFSPPLSPGEGPHAPSNFLFDGSDPSSLTISFATQVLGAGLFIIDFINPSGNNPLTVEAFTGANGTGTSLGSFSSVDFNFQPNNQYFMGIVSTDGDIGSMVFTDVNSTGGDTTGIDDIRFAVDGNGGGNQMPEPPSLVLLGLGLAGLGVMRRRKSR